ncbi:MAG: putative inorganic carbon transporter subunit DabA [Candidatus Nitrotoga sp.]
MHEAYLKSGDQVSNLREQIRAAIHHLDHVLPGQAPLHNFVHHNTLHGFQHLPFEKALAAGEALTGIYGYLPETLSRNCYQQGRIDDSDILAALAHDPQLKAEQIVCQAKDRTIRRKDIYRIALLFDLQPLTVSQFNWQVEELNATDAVQADVPDQIRNQLRAGSSVSDNVIRQLWETILTKLEMEDAGLHPENLLDLSLEQAEEWLEHVHDGNMLSIHERMQQQASEALDNLLGQLGDGITLRGFILAMSGIDILDSIRPQLIRICASCMDEGIAAWQAPERRRLGLYASWRATARYDANPYLDELPNWQAIMAELPVDAVDTIIW